MTAAEAISFLNDRRLKVSDATLSVLIRVITRAAFNNDPHASRFLWLVNWNPQQLVN